MTPCLIWTKPDAPTTQLCGLDTDEIPPNPAAELLAYKVAYRHLAGAAHALRGFQLVPPR